MNQFIVSFLTLPFKLLAAPFRRINPRVGCLLLAILVALAFIFCGMTARLTAPFY